MANLVVNAARYGHGRITDSTRNDGGRSILSVFNSDLRIPFGLLRTLFNPPTRKQQLSGAGRAADLGLGLLIYQSIAGAPGEMRVELNEDGTTFLVTLQTGQLG